jgi:hypothetical protein
LVDHSKTVIGIVCIGVADILLSIGISVLITVVIDIVIDDTLTNALALVREYFNLTRIDPYDAMLISTLFTSVWTILILLSTTVVKLLAPVQRSTGWFFDVEKHPIQAIGIVAGALVMIGSGVWAIVRAVV